MADESPIITQRTGSDSSIPAVDSRLLAAIADGDPDAFGRLYDAVVSTAYRVAYAILHNRELAEEAVQELFIDLWRNPNGFDPDRGSFNRYVGLMAHAKAVDRVRSSVSAKAREARYGARNVDPGGGQDPVFDRAALRAEHSAVRGALAGLTSHQRNAIVLVYFEHRTYAEAAQLLGTTPEAVRTRVRGGVLKLRRLLTGPQA